MLDEGQAIAPAAAGVGHFERVLYLRKVMPTLSAHHLAIVAERMRERVFAKGDVLFREGEPVEAMQFLMQGTVHVSRGGRELGHSGAGTAVGGASMFAREPIHLEVVAETPLASLELSEAAVMEIFEDHFPILLNVIRYFCEQVIQLSRTAPALLPAIVGEPGEPMPDRELDLVERIFLLRRMPVFRKSSINALVELSRGMSEVRYEPGTVLWRTGEPSGWVSLIVSGTVMASPPGGQPFAMEPGTPAGSVEAMGNLPRWYDAAAATPARALHGNIQGVIDVFEDNIDMALDYLALTAKRFMDGFERALEGQDKEILRLYGCEDAEAHEG